MKIQCQYDQTTQCVSIFKNQNSTIGQMTKKLQAAKDQLQGGDWVGKGAKSFYNEMDQKVLPALKALSQAMDGGAMNLTKAHKTMQKAEEDSKNIFLKIDIQINI
jgi:WXG100 family type VII secretion target